MIQEMFFRKRAKKAALPNFRPARLLALENIKLYFLMLYHSGKINAREMNVVEF
jgi:hypothetical protein